MGSELHKMRTHLQGAEGRLQLDDAHPVLGLIQRHLHQQRCRSVEDQRWRSFDRGDGGGGGVAFRLGVALAPAVALARVAAFGRDDLVFGLVVRIESVGAVLAAVEVAAVTAGHGRDGRNAVALRDPLVAVGAAAAEARVAHRRASESARAAETAAVHLHDSIKSNPFQLAFSSTNEAHPSMKQREYPLF